MEIIVDKNILINSLQRTQYILDKSSALQQSPNVLIKSNAKFANIIAFDIDCNSKATLPADIVEAGEICVNGKKIFEIVKNLAKEKVRLIKKGEDNLVTITDEKSDFHIISADPEDFPAIDFTPPDEFCYVQADILKKLIDRTIFSIARIPDARYNLEGVYVEVLAGAEKETNEAAGEQEQPENAGGEETGEKEKREIAFVATDGYRVSVAKTDQIGGNISLGERRIFSRKSLVEIKNIFADSETLKISFSGNNVHIIGETFVLILRMLKGKFPDYRKMIPTSFTTRVILPREDLLSILRRMKVLAYDKYKGVEMNFAREKLTVSIHNPEMGDAREEMKVQYDGEPFSISFDITYLLDFLQVVTAAEIEMLQTAGLHPCVMKELGSDDFINGIMPMKS